MPETLEAPVQERVNRVPITDDVLNVQDFNERIVVRCICEAEVSRVEAIGFSTDVGAVARKVGSAQRTRQSNTRWTNASGRCLPHLRNIVDRVENVHRIPGTEP